MARRIGKLLGTAAGIAAGAYVVSRFVKKHRKQAKPRKRKR